MERRGAGFELRGITTPTLLLLAEDTILYDPEAMAERARRLLADVTIDITPKAGHGLAFQYPELVTGHILPFVEEDHERRRHEKEPGGRPDPEL